MNEILLACLCVAAATFSSCTPERRARTPGVQGRSAVRELNAARALGKREAIRLKINHYRVPCVGEAPRLCYLVKRVDQDQAEWELFYDAIEGFGTYEWGHTYEVIVAREEVEDPPQDASRFRYILSEVLTDQEVPNGTEFSFRLDAGEIRPYVSGSPAVGFDLLGELAIECETEEVCAEFSRALAASRTVRATFRHAREEGAVRLVSVAEP